MLIVGAGGHAVEVLDVLEKNNVTENIFFFDDVSTDLPKLRFGKYEILKDKNDVKKLFEIDNEFILGIGIPSLRKKMAFDFFSIGGNLISLISVNSLIGQHDVILGKGLNIMHGVIITNEIKIGEGTLVNSNVCIHHGSSIGNYCDISPGCQINGNVSIGDLTSLGASSVVIPRIKIGSNVVIGAGSVVTKDIPDNALAYGVPARIINGR